LRYRFLLSASRDGNNIALTRSARVDTPCQGIGIQSLEPPSYKYYCICACFGFYLSLNSRALLAGCFQDTALMCDSVTFLLIGPGQSRKPTYAGLMNGRHIFAHKCSEAIQVLIAACASWQRCGRFPEALLRHSFSRIQVGCLICAVPYRTQAHQLDTGLKPNEKSSTFPPIRPLHPLLQSALCRTLNSTHWQVAKIGVEYFDGVARSALFVAKHGAAPVAE